QPEHNRAWNLGYSATIGRATIAQVVLFRNDLRNAIQSIYVTDPGGSGAATAVCPASRIIGFCSEMANIGKEVHQGFELEVRTSAIPRVTLNTSYSYLNRTLRYDFSKVPNVSVSNSTISILPVLPKNKLIGTASVRIVRQVLGIVNARYEGGLTL